jgi:hypothetical protein
MPQDTETAMLLRKSLDAVDRHRKRIYATVGVVGLITLWTFYRLIEATPTLDVRGMLRQSVVLILLWTATWALAVVFQLTRMTKIILRAIELAAKP